MIVVIKLTKGYTTIIDDEDADLASLTWCVVIHKRPTHPKYAFNGKSGLYLHKIILLRILGRKLLKGEEVDHKDRNGLNNTRNNLRLATLTQNRINTSKINRVCSSKFKGVCKDNSKHRVRRWVAQLSYQGKAIHIGRYLTEIEAAMAYNSKVVELYGEFAYLNDVEEK